MRAFKIPHVFVLLTIAVFFASLLTYVVPSGEYERTSKTFPDGSSATVVVPGTYEHKQKVFTTRGLLLNETPDEGASPVGLTGFLSAIPRGMEEAADIIFFIFILGGVFGILTHTGVINGFIQLLLNTFGNNGPLLIALLMMVIAVCGSTLGMGEEFIPLIPVFLLVAHRLGYDRVLAVAIVNIGAQIGFAAATTNPFNVVIAQKIAELNPYSGMGLRATFFVCAITLSIVHVLRYGARIRRDPAASVMGEAGFQIEERKAEEFTFTKAHLITTVACALIFVFILFATQKFGWWLAEMAGGFMLMAIVAIIVCRLTLEESAQAFVRGMESMVVAALVVGFAKGITVVLSDGQIMDTVIHSAAELLKDTSNYVAAVGMLVFQTLLNVIIPSGSGQAAVTMPLMAPLADVIGLTRQTAVFAFQCGDGFSNTIIPTSGILMSMLGLAKVPYEKWLKFALPLFLQLMTLSAVFLIAAVAMGYA